jgi:aspartyl/glutamyl-tRNA(Asn/Gln) amidotransferase C subunit
MAIDRSDLLRVAELARLRLSESETDRLTRDCQAILKYFETIRGIGADVAETEAAEHAAPLREDGGDRDLLESPPHEMAPAWRDGYFVLPRLPAMDAEFAEDDS